MDWRIILLLIVTGILVITFLVMLFKLRKLEDEKLELQADLAINKGELKTALEGLARSEKFFNELPELSNEELFIRLRDGLDKWYPADISSGNKPE